jgi:ubiquinone/menaquinone biosynthesis C-methylase UbiE
MDIYKKGNKLRAEYKKFYEEIAKIDIQNLRSKKGVESTSKEYRWDQLKKQIFDLLIVAPDDLILDVGCGFGENLFKIERPKFRGIGIDVAVPYILWNYQQTKKQGKTNLDFLVADVHYLPFKRETFDEIIFSEVIEHILNPKEALKDLHRVCKKEGYVILTTPNKYDAIRILSFIYRKTFGRIVQFLLEKKRENKADLDSMEILLSSMERESGVKLHKRVYTYRCIRRNVQKAGFKIEVRRAGSLDTYPIHGLLDKNPSIFYVFKMLNKLTPAQIKNEIILKLRKQ